MANIVLQRYWDHMLPVDLNAIAKKMSVDLANTTEGVGGLKIEHEKITLFFNDQEPAVRQRFVVAHMLGRHALDLGSIENVGAEAFQLTTEDANFQAANDFALGLLLPEKELQKVVESGQFNNVQEISEIFGASTVAVCERIKQLKFFQK